MAVHTETKTEIVAFSALAAFLAFLWWHNRAQGAGDGLGAFPSFEDDQSAQPLIAPATLPAAVPGEQFSVTIPGANLPAPGVYNLAGGQAGSCNCSDGSGNTMFGSNADLTAFLASNPSILANAEDGLKNWT